MVGSSFLGLLRRVMAPSVERNTCHHLLSASLILGIVFPSSNNNLTSQVLGVDSFITGIQSVIQLYINVYRDTVVFLEFCTNLLLTSHKRHFLVQSLDSTHHCTGVHLPSADKSTRQVIKNDCPASWAVQFWTKKKKVLSENSKLV